MQDEKPENIRRRAFLLTAGVGSAGTVAALASGAGRGPEVKAVMTVSAEKKTRGYAETPHISNYYRTARV